MNKEILNKFSNFLVKVIAVIFVVLMGINSLLVLTKTAVFPKDYQETLYYENVSAILNIMFLIIFSIVILILARYLKKIISVQRLVLIVMIYAFIISILFAILRRDYVQFDPFNVIDQANNFIRENYSGLDKGNNYLYIYSHQITTVFLFQIILSLFGRATFILYIMQSFSISYIIFMLYKISNIMFDDEDTNYLVVILSGLCFPLIFYVAFVYGLLPGMFLTLLAYYYFIKYIKHKKWYMLVISAICINVAILFIGNNLIHMLAIFSAAVIYLIRVRGKKVIVFMISCLFLMSASKSLIYNYYEVKSQKTIADGVPKITWIAMGMQEGDREAGWWNRFNYDIMPEEDYDTKRITEISKDSIKQRVEVFKKNPRYAVDFYQRKYENQFIEPTFQSLLVTAPQRNFDNETKLEKVKDFFVKQIYFDETHHVLTFIMKVFQVFVYVFSVVFAVNVYKKKKEILTIIPVAFIGGTLFHMIWEAKSRYVFPYFVFLIPLAAYGLVIVRNKITEYRKNKEEKMKKVIYKAFIITLLGLTVSAPAIKANDVYVPFGEKKFTEIENSEKIEFDDLNLKAALIEYYKFHINKDFKGEEMTVGMMEQFTSLSLPWKNIFSLKGLEYAVNLKNLNLSNNFIEDITPLEKLVELEDLNLTNNKIKDSKSLAKLTKLRQLVLRKNLMNNLDFLNDLKVESLDISMNSVLKDYIPNNLKLNNLRSLNLSGIGLDNISFLKNAGKLESLVAEENAIKDITALAELKSLRTLYLDRNNISDITALKDLASLEELLLYKNNIENVDALKDKKYLYRLMLNDNLGLKNIDALKDVPNISSLDISNTSVTDISALKDAKYLYYIALKDTKISDGDIAAFEKGNLEVKKSNNIDKKLEIVKTEAAKYFSIKNYIFMVLILIFTFSGIRSYWRKNK